MTTCETLRIIELFFKHFTIKIIDNKQTYYEICIRSSNFCIIEMTIRVFWKRPPTSANSLQTEGTISTPDPVSNVGGGGLVTRFCCVSNVKVLVLQTLGDRLETQCPETANISRDRTLQTYEQVPSSDPRTSRATKAGPSSGAARSTQ